jgi:hypothetical protein
MPINPNIALGAQTPAPVNFLGQMGQMLALKGAAQEIQGGEALRDFYASGGNATTPEGARALMAANPKMGMQILKGQSEMSARDVETQAKSLKSIKDNVSLVNSPEGMVEFLRGAYSTPGGALLAKLAPLDKAIAAIPSDPRAFADYKRNLGLTSEKLFESADAQLSSKTSLATAGMTAQTAANRLGFDERKFKFEQENPGFEYKTLNDGSIAAVNKRSNAVTILQAPGAAPTPATPPVNALAPTSAAATPAANLNALLNPPVVNQPGAPTIANAAALATTPLRAAPRPGYEYNAQGQQVPISDPTKVVNTVTDRFGNVSMLNAAGDVIKKVEGMGKPSAGVERQQEREVVSKEGKESVNRVLGTLYSEYNNLVKSGGITDTRKSTEENIAARTGASGVGQLTGSFTGSEAQSFRDAIEQTRPLLLTAIMKATGLSATQLNSNVELQTYLKTATDPKVSIQSNVKALNNISTMFGIGEKFEVPEVKTPKEAKAADTPPAGLPPDIAALWPYISPEDRKLWQK